MYIQRIALRCDEIDLLGDPPSSTLCIFQARVIFVATLAWRAWDYSAALTELLLPCDGLPCPFMVQFQSMPMSLHFASVCLCERICKHASIIDCCSVFDASYVMDRPQLTNEVDGEEEAHMFVALSVLEPASQAAPLLKHMFR